MPGSRDCSATRTRADPVFTETIALDLAEVEPSLAGPKRPQDRVPLARAASAFAEALDKEYGKADEAGKRVPVPGRNFDLGHGDVVIAAITSCTNTSNPFVMVAAGLLARNAVKRGLAGEALGEDLARAGLAGGDRLSREGRICSSDLDPLGFNLVGYGCTTCIGNSGPLPEEISKTIHEHGLAVASVLSGNRNFEGRVNHDVRANYLASPPLVVAYALAGSIMVDLATDPLGIGADGEPVYLKDIWPSSKAIAKLVRKAVKRSMFRRRYGNVFEGDEEWQEIEIKGGLTYDWDGSVHLCAEPALFRRPLGHAGAGDGHRRRAHPRPVPRLRSPPTTSRPRARSGVTARRGITSPSMACRRTTSIPTARGAAITR